MSSPALRNNPAFSAQPNALSNFGEPMTIEGTLQKTFLSFAVLLIGAALSYGIVMAGMVSQGTYTVMIVIAALTAFILGMVNAFKKEPSPPLILSYAALQGFAVGGISLLAELAAPGIIIQAVLATLIVCAVTFALFTSGRVRATPKMTKFWMIAMVSYLAFSLVNIVLSMTGVTNDVFGMNSATIFGIPIGLIIGILAVLLATYSLIMDFTFIQNGVKNRIPAKYGWTGAFGLMVTIVWLYLEMLRILSILRR